MMRNRLLLLFLGALTAFLLTGCSKNYQAEREFWKAEKVLNDVKKTDIQAKGAETALAPAILAFERVIDKFPGSVKSVESLFVISNLQIRMNKLADARDTLKKVVQNFSNLQDRTIEAREGIARIYEVEGNWEKSEETYWELAEYHPMHVKGLYAPVHVVIHYKKVNDIAGRKKAFDRAIAYYEEKLKVLGPIDAAGAVVNYKGLVQLANGDWQDARQTWLSISENHPESPFAALALLSAAELSSGRKDFGSAIDAYKKFFERYPTHMAAGKGAYSLGLVYSGQKEFGSAREWFDKALTLLGNNKNATADVKLTIARTYEEENLPAKADEYYEQVKKDHPESPAALQVPLLLFQRYNKAGENDKAAQILDDAIKTYGEVEAGADPQMASVAQRLQNTAFAQKGEWEEIMSNFDESYASEKSFSRKGSWLFLKALLAENRLKDNVKALSFYKIFLDEYPNHPLAALARTRSQNLLKTA